MIGIALWVWLKKTRTGMVIRAGVDDRAMVAALGVNIQRTFMIAFFVGSALAGMGAVIGTSQTAVANGTDSTWLLNSLVVVIIGGMGSLGGRGDRLAAVRHHRHVLGGLPAAPTTRSTRSSSRSSCSRSCSRCARTASSGGLRELHARRSSASVGGVAIAIAVLAPLLFSEYTVDQLLTQVLIFGIVAMSLIFLASYGGMVSLAQTAIFGIAGFVFGNLTTVDTKGLALGYSPWVGHHPGAPDRDRDRPRLRRASPRARPASTSS